MLTKNNTPVALLLSQAVFLQGWSPKQSVSAR
jgi:hypothetical protein